ncbi:MAG: diguanylate cyclase [Aureliella sp.]
MNTVQSENNTYSGQATVVATDPKSSLNDQIVQRRLGAYSGLFFALRAKHPPTAAHTLRVALGCSRWAIARGLGDPDASILEIAALLHDVGKIGIPDAVLQKPARLSEDELLLMDMHQSVAEELLLGAGATADLMAIVCPSRREGISQLGRTMVQMLEIVDAYDSMTTQQVFREALSRDAAIDELFAHSGDQFDGELAKEFAELVCRPQADLDAKAANRWVYQLVPDQTPGFSEGKFTVAFGAQQNVIDEVFQPKLLETMSDAAVYLDSEGQILLWNRAAEELTGRDAGTVQHTQWSKELMGLYSVDGKPLTSDQCPLAAMNRTNTKTTSRLLMKVKSGSSISVKFTAIPVIRARGRCGSILLLRDASSEANLEKKVESLNEMAHKDPLTKVSNRAYLEKQLPAFVDEHLRSGLPGSLIICDIDYFKKINDTFGHQAGDDALVTFAGILRDTARESDIVARFGGEEFVIICRGCSNTAAAGRAEDMRRAVLNTPVPSLDGRTMTASFGVTEIQSGDTHELVLSRADRALMDAKESGRNRVIQVGAGQRTSDDPELSTNTVEQSGEVEDEASRQQRESSWLAWFRGETSNIVVESKLLAAVPREIAIQKLAGFIQDYNGEVVESEEDSVAVRVDMAKWIADRRSGVRPAILLVEIDILAVEYRRGKGSEYQSRTKLSVSIRPVRSRDRRKDAVLNQAKQLLVSIGSYLVTQEITPELEANIIEPR